MYNEVKEDVLLEAILFMEKEVKIEEFKDKVSDVIENIVKRSGMVETIKRGSLPMGIVEKAKAENVVRRLRPSDMVVLVSDGISEAGPAMTGGSDDEGSGWIENTLIELKSSDPQTVADLLLGKALERYGDGEKDDMSILVFTVS